MKATPPKEGAFIGWKAAVAIIPLDERYYTSEMCIVKLEIPEEAKRLKTMYYPYCRCDKAKVVEIQSICEERLDDCIKAESIHACHFLYATGEMVVASGFEQDRKLIHGEGIYFFMDREEAVYYSKFESPSPKYNHAISQRMKRYL